MTPGQIAEGRRLKAAADAAWEAYVDASDAFFEWRQRRAVELVCWAEPAVTETEART